MTVTSSMDVYGLPTTGLLRRVNYFLDRRCLDLTGWIRFSTGTVI